MALDERTQNEYEKLKTAPAPVEERKELSDKLGTKQEEGSDLEKKTMFSSFKKFTAWDWTKTAITTTIGITTAGIANWASVMGSFLLAYKTLNRKKITYEGVKTEVHTANLYTPLVYYFYKGLDSITNPITKTAMGLGPMMLAFMPAYLAMTYLVKNFSPKKMFNYLYTGKFLKIPSDIYKKTIKPDLKQSFKDFYKYLTIPWIGITNFVPFKYQIAALSGLRYLFRLVTARSQEKNSNNHQTTPTHQPTPTPTPAYGGAK
ncbi:hypothetical protein HQ529_01650 [Candidatus Woesearchaeota archaeon]|nr:hypothetical protein [Candidatus Woesearchaeota archaeon]